MEESQELDDNEYVENLRNFGEGYTFLIAEKEYDEKKILKEVPEALDKYKAID